MSKVAFYTLGCKVNHYESEAMMDQFKQSGYEIVDFDKKADIYIIHSCTVTNQAASKSRKYARRAKRRNPHSIVVMVGCYPQVFPAEVEDVEEVDYILGTEGKSNIVNLIENKDEDNYLQSIKKRSQFSNYEDIRVYELRETTRANIKIQEGCNQFCSYCIIPYARGPLRSRSEGSIINEVRELAAANIREIVLTGIHLGGYGTDLNNDQSLDRLIDKLLDLDYNFRIRLSSIEVTEITDRLIELMAGEERLCSHLHIPLQSGSDKILEDMNRPYNVDEFNTIVKNIRNKVADIGISTDVIVGFPGESDSGFEDSYQLIEKLEFSRLHVFPYSRREGTAAAKMKDQVHGNKKKKRSKRLRDLNKRLMLDFQKKFINSEREVIIEEKRDYNTNMLTGYTDNYIRVLVDDSDKYMTQKLPVKLNKSYNYESMIGEIV